MFGPRIWDFYASWYDRLWVQKIVLAPSRRLILKTMEELSSPGHVLDVGCGIGELCFEMSRLFPHADIVGIDPSEKMIRRAKKDFSGSNIAYHCGITDYLSKKQKFDIIVTTNAFPYMLDKSGALSEMKEHLKPDGRLLLLCANCNNQYDAFWLSLVKMTTSKAHYPSVSSIHELMKECGFSVGKTERIRSLFLIPSVFMVEGILSNSHVFEKHVNI